MGLCAAEEAKALPVAAAGEASQLEAIATDVAEVVEVTELCAELERCLEAALERAGGDASHVVLVLDLDETAFTPLNPDALGTSAWFEDIHKRWVPKLELSDTMSSIETLFAILGLVDAFYPRVPVGPSDDALPALLRKYNAAGVSSMGLTARRPALSTATWAQMGDRCNFEFIWPAAPKLEGLDDLLRSPEHVRDPKSWEGLSFERGVWFTSNVNKGSLLRAVLQPGMHVVFADDSVRHLVAANAALDGHAASVACLHFTAATSAASKNLNAAKCDEQLAAHIVDLFEEKDPLTTTLVQTCPFVQRFLAEQLSCKGVSSDLKLRLKRMHMRAYH